MRLVFVIFTSFEHFINFICTWELLLQFIKMQPRSLGLRKFIKSILSNISY